MGQVGFLGASSGFIFLWNNFKCKLAGASFCSTGLSFARPMINVVVNYNARCTEVRILLVAIIFKSIVHTRNVFRCR